MLTVILSLLFIYYLETWLYFLFKTNRYYPRMVLSLKHLSKFEVLVTVYRISFYNLFGFSLGIIIEQSKSKLAHLLGFKINRSALQFLDYL